MIISKGRIVFKVVIVLMSISFSMTNCSDENIIEDTIGKYGETPAEYIAFLDDNEINYYLDQFGNPYTQGELLLKLDNGFNKVNWIK